MEDDRLSGPPAPHLIARLLSIEKESSPCHNSPSPSTTNACFSPAITLELFLLCLSRVFSQPAWRILFTSSQLSFPLPASSPHPGKNFYSGSTLASLTQCLLSIYSALSLYLDKEIFCSPCSASCQGLGAAGYPIPASHVPLSQPWLCSWESCPLPPAAAWGEVEPGAPSLPPTFLIRTVRIITSSHGELLG